MIPSTAADHTRWKPFLHWFAVVFSIFQIWLVVLSTVDPLLQRAIFLTGILTLAFLGYRPERSAYRDAPNTVEIVEAMLAAGCGAYFFSQIDRYLYRWPLVDALTGVDIVVGALMLLLVLDLTRRYVGWAVLVIAVVFAAYALAGHMLPGVFSHRVYTVPEFLDQMVFTLNGIFGAPLAVAATYVFMFVIFGVALFHSGTGKFFMGVAQSLAARATGGAAKVAVISCGLFGMFSGSPTSDAVTTGTFTIPFMKRVGYKSAEAGAIVAVAATGGGIMPPIMGSAAFLMAEFTGIRYVNIAIAATLPGILYYLCPLAQLHFQALKENKETAPEQAGPPFRELIARNWQFVIPILALTWMLLTATNPVKAAGVAAALTVMVSWVRPETRMGLSKIADVLDESARATVMVVGATASAGILVGSFAITGLGGKFSGMLFEMAGQNLLPALIITMIICLILGMGMPTPSAYILTAVVAVPALVRLGIPVLSAHMFVLYFACLSAITPPVAVAAFATAGIAGADPNEVGFRAVRLGIVAFLVPFIFVYQPALLLRGSLAEVVIAAATSITGVILLAAGIEGWLLARAVWWERAMLMVGGILLLIPGLYTDIPGVILAAAVLAIQWRKRA
ncbi:MAG: TRAP transporter permease [Acidobacteria bacterium]|nr:TRAP transporter permease [Acidobacteriota bacterium]